jgi:anthranilate synthase component II
MSQQSHKLPNRTSKMIDKEKKMGAHERRPEGSCSGVPSGERAKILIIDNYDSFTYNLYQYLAELGGNPVVHRNDEITLDEIKEMKPTHIVISPGPGTPEKERDFGICTAVIQDPDLAKTPILGVCLGHQGIIHLHGGKIVRAPEIVHGKQSEMHIRNHNGLFRGLPEKFEAMRYHSLIGDRSTIPEELEITAETTKDGLVMAITHRTRPLYGIQFHPESIGTPHGKQILKNFLTN